MRTALVTGAAGFVGRHIGQALGDADYCVTGIDLRSARGVIQMDALDLFRNHCGRYDVFIHCAAIVGGRATIDGSPLAVATNLALDSWAFMWARKHADRMVYFSSSAAYPVALQTESALYPLAESDIDLVNTRQPDSTYGLAKVTGEQLAMVARAEGQHVAIFRPFSGTGEDQDLTYPVPAICDRVRRREAPLVVWSDTVRDFVHVDDIIGAVFAALKQGVTGPVNLCSGVPTSFTELARRAALLAGYHPDIEVLNDKPTGVARRVGDPTLMHTFYKPRIGLDEILGRCLTAERRAA